MSDNKTFNVNSKLSELVACLEMATDHLSEIMLRQAIKQMLEREYGAVFDEGKKADPSETEWKIHEGNENPAIGKTVVVICADGERYVVPSHQIDWGQNIPMRVIRYRVVK